jgi:phospholipid/cholesterol/gamma-HCH transport system permease protein
VSAATENLRLYAGLVASSASRLRVLANPMVRLVFLRQIHFTAVRSLRLLSVLAVLIGAAFVGHVTHVLGADKSVFDLVDLVLLRNVAPLSAAIIVIGRSATAIGSELALMRCNGEMDALHHLRISVHDYLIVPRIAAVTLATMGCCFYFQVTAVFGGFAVSALMLDVSLTDQLERFAHTVTVATAALEVAKSLCFGFCIGAIACATGLNAAPRITEVPLVPARAFLRALLAVVAIDGVFLLATW